MEVDDELKEDALVYLGRCLNSGKGSEKLHQARHGWGWEDTAIDGLSQAYNQYPGKIVCILIQIHQMRRMRAAGSSTPVAEVCRCAHQFSASSPFNERLRASWGERERANSSTVNRAVQSK